MLTGGSTACGPLKTAIEIDSLSLNASTYSYCAFWDAPQVEKCTACLRASEDGHITANCMSDLTTPFLNRLLTGL